MKNTLKSILAKMLVGLGFPFIMLGIILALGISIDIATAPAFNVSAQTEEGRVLVHGFDSSAKGGSNISVEFKRGDSFRLQQLAAELKADVVLSYDISLRDKMDNSKWQPSSPVKVNVLLAKPAVLDPSKKTELVHVLHDGQMEKIKDWGCDVKDDKVISFWFIAESFSVYAIVQSDNGLNAPGRRLYDFYSLDFDKDSPTYN